MIFNQNYLNSLRPIRLLHQQPLLFHCIPLIQFEVYFPFSLLKLKLPDQLDLIQHHHTYQDQYHLHNLILIRHDLVPQLSHAIPNSPKGLFYLGKCPASHTNRRCATRVFHSLRTHLHSSLHPLVIDQENEPDETRLQSIPDLVE